MSTIPEAFYETTHTYAAKTAFTFIDRSFSYKEYNTLSNRIAHALISRGLKPGDRVAIHLPNLPQYLVFMLGALKAGCIISGLSPLASEREIELQLKDLGAAAVISFDDVFTPQVQKLVRALPAMKAIVVTRPLDLMPLPIQFFARLLGKVPHRDIALGDRREVWFDDFMKGQSEADVLVPRFGADIAAIQYTGGTTGNSKGAMLSHSNLLNNIRQSIAVTHPEIGSETGLSILPFFHIAGLTAALNTIVIAGAWLLIPNPRDLPALVKEMGQWKFSTMTGVNTLFNGLLHTPGFDQLDFSHLKVVVGGGAAVQKPTAERWQQLTGQYLTEAYGLTEELKPEVPEDQITLARPDPRRRARTTASCGSTGSSSVSARSRPPTFRPIRISRSSIRSR